MASWIPPLPVSVALASGQAPAKKLPAKSSSEGVSSEMNLALTWTQGAGPCFTEGASTWKACSLSDWNQGGVTSFVESWRSGGTSAERDESASSLPLVPGSAPEVVRMRPKPSKAKRASKPKTPQLKKSHAQEPSVPGIQPIGELGDVNSEDPAPSLVGMLSMGLVLPELQAKGFVEAVENPRVPLKCSIVEGGVLPKDCTAVKGKVLEGGASKLQQTGGEGGDNLKFDFVVVGSGIAGLRFALDVAERGTVAVVTKAERQEGSTRYAQGGVSAVLDPGDSVENHIRDTIVAGAYLNDEEVVEVVCREGPERVRELMAMGASFDRGEDGRLQLAREGGHSHHRIVHTADVTGREIERALLVAAQKNPNISLFEHHFVIDLLTTQEEDGECTCFGVDALDVRSGKVLRFLAGSTLLASGGAGHVYPNTTNPPVATGDGIALAQRALAVISNMEFVQFHPTALADEGLPTPPPTPRSNAFLITEAARGAGGILYNQAGERFMLEYDPRAELAPRDIVARSIDDQLKKRGERFVWLDISHLPAAEILGHFPNIAEECRRWGIDITKQPIPVVPAAHYMCGGVLTGLHGETSVKGLWAAGEVACTGLHGANRLASNSLLEALVFAQRAVQPAIEHALSQRDGHASQGMESGSFEEEVRAGAKIGWKCTNAYDWELLSKLPRAVGVAESDVRAVNAAEITLKFRHQLQDVMWRYVGIVRSTERLLVAEHELKQLAEEWKSELASTMLPAGAVTAAVCEMRNLLAVAMLIVQSALRRQESRGLHFTTDFPESLEAERLPTVLSPGSVMQLWPNVGKSVFASRPSLGESRPSPAVRAQPAVEKIQPSKRRLI